MAVSNWKYFEGTPTDYRIRYLCSEHLEQKLGAGTLQGRSAGRTLEGCDQCLTPAEWLDYHRTHGRNYSNLPMTAGPGDGARYNQDRYGMPKNV